MGPESLPDSPARGWPGWIAATPRHLRFRALPRLRPETHGVHSNQGVIAGLLFNSPWTLTTGTCTRCPWNRWAVGHHPSISDWIEAALPTEATAVETTEATIVIAEAIVVDAPIEAKD